MYIFIYILAPQQKRVFYYPKNWEVVTNKVFATACSCKNLNANVLIATTERGCNYNSDDYHRTCVPAINSSKVLLGRHDIFF